MNVCDLEEEKRERSLDNNSYVSDQDMCFRKKGRREKTRSDRIFGKRKSDFEMGGPVFIGDKKVAVAGGGSMCAGNMGFRHKNGQIWIFKTFYDATIPQRLRSNIIKSSESALRRNKDIEVTPNHYGWGKYRQPHHGTILSLNGGKQGTLAVVRADIGGMLISEI
ncbi:hypothetical protein Tco_0925813 [Tanacetum coccineum]|uniref:Uncharacterized protein n=1 Tax=Tanacetum coccineum TaxID=301880 RepID=A0ABQ5DEZ2_9ASTR